MQTRLKTGLLALACMAVWTLMPAGALAGLSGSVHDFTSGNPGTTFDVAGSLCETCHIPHNSTSTQLLWNHTMSTNTLTLGGGSTIRGTTLPSDIGAKPGSSKFCLSCHDGSVAVGDMIVGTNWGSDKIPAGNTRLGSGDGDISGNHPVEVPYVGETYDSVTSAALVGDYNDPPNGSIVLYNDGTGEGVVCASCHDPHSTTNNKFLREPKATICTNCHIK